MFKLETNYSIIGFCEDLLKRRFPGDPLKQSINDSDGDKLNFACPYCGDSTHDSNKKRGNLYLSTQTYKCYNDGCAVWVPLEKFIGHFAPKYQLDLPNLGEKKAEFKPEVSVKKRGFLIEFLINREVGEKLLSIKSLVDRFGLIPCCEASPASPVGQFVDRRKINRLPVFEQSCYFDSREDKVYIFNLDIRSGRVLGFAIRRLDDSFGGPKYNIKNYTEFKKNGLVPKLEDSFIQEVDSINNYFNILNVDFTKPVTVTEGQIDAMFVRNCVASTGVTKSKNLLGSLISKKNARVLFDNDKAGKDQSLSLIKEGYRVFLWNKLTFNLKKEYPGQSREIRGIKDVNDLFRFMLLHDPDLDFEKFNLHLDKYFSDSAFDLLLV